MSVLKKWPKWTQRHASPMDAHNKASETTQIGTKIKGSFWFVETSHLKTDVSSRVRMQAGAVISLLFFLWYQCCKEHSSGEVESLKPIRTSSTKFCFDDQFSAIFNEVFSPHQRLHWKVWMKFREWTTSNPYPFCLKLAKQLKTPLWIAMLSRESWK